MQHNLIYYIMLLLLLMHGRVRSILMLCIVVGYLVFCKSIKGIFCKIWLI